MKDKNQQELSKQNDSVTACKMELDAHMLMFTAACIRGESRAMVNADTACQEVLSRWLEQTASMYEMARRMTYD